LLDKGPGLARGSILDITNTSTYVEYGFTVPEVNGTLVDGRLQVVLPNLTFEALSADSYSLQHTSAQTPYYTYDLTFEATTSTLLNGGGSGFSWGSALSWKWGLPACRKTGNFSINGQELLTIDPTQSFTR
jgi:hypothetical protein